MEKYRWWFVLLCPVLIVLSVFSKTGVLFNALFLGGIFSLVIGIFSFSLLLEQYKKFFILFGIFWVILTFYINSKIPTNLGLGFPVIRLFIAGIAIFLMGAVSYFSMPKWLKILLVFILIPVIPYLTLITLFFLGFGPH